MKLLNPHTFPTDLNSDLLNSLCLLQFSNSIREWIRSYRVADYLYRVAEKKNTNKKPCIAKVIFWWAMCRTMCTTLSGRNKYQVWAVSKGMVFERCWSQKGSRLWPYWSEMGKAFHSGGGIGYCVYKKLISSLPPSHMFVQIEASSG